MQSVDSQKGAATKQNTVSHLFGESNPSLDDYLLLLAQAFPGQVGWQPDFNAILTQQPDDARGLTALCWAYALDNQPELALPYCDRAIQQKASPWAYDGRALARASQGHWPGTVEDPQAFLTWLDDQAFAGRDALETTHRAWLAAARAGQNPFDATVRARLRKE